MTSHAECYELGKVPSHVFSSLDCAIFDQVNITAHSLRLDLGPSFARKVGEGRRGLS